jgi:acetyl-CoA acetyltransferase
VKRAGIQPDEVEDVVMGCAMQQGTMVMNVARKGAIRAGLPVTVAGTTIDRQCASGLQAIAVAARSVIGYVGAPLVREALLVARETFAEMHAENSVTQ